jgi:hypothetical protein
MRITLHLDQMTAFLLIAFVGCGCASNRSHTPVLAPAFYGTWTNVNPRYYNWWVISASGAVAYGIALNRGKCGAYSATVVDPEHINVTFGNSGKVHLRISDNGLLVFENVSATAYHKRVEPESICERADGGYFEFAPHPRTNP